MSRQRTREHPGQSDGQSLGAPAASDQGADQAPPTSSGETADSAVKRRTRKPKTPEPWLLSIFTHPDTGADSVAAFASGMPDYIEQMIEHRAANGNVKDAYRLFNCQPVYMASR